MKAVLCKAWGLPDTLVVEELPDLVASAGQVVIDVKAAGVNFPDVLIIQNKYQFKPELPFTPGSELSGVVRAVGDGVSNIKVGDKVIAFIGHSAFAQQVVAPAQAVMPMPLGMDFDTAAAITLTYGTSHHAVVDRAQLKAGETMLVLGAAGGVGLAAIEIGKALGARVIAAASSDEKLAICKEHGADLTINYSTQDLREAIKAATDGKGPDVIYDPVGGIYAEPAFRSIAWRGRYLVVGFANGEIPKLPLNLTLLKGASLVGVFWGEFAKREPKANLAAMRELIGWLAEGKIKPRISGRYALKDTAIALNDIAARKVTGKVVIQPEK
ncbi:NADPH:quinone oxidoreductase family protein [Undibacterium sp. RTI2.1]|uniref:NADPH:quinone oxidoreductase family protein n=1 Tax=unclassified Undibacterium TaxID=2630295 RepID=UPI002AB4D366|nr:MULTISPECIES: NADPH:quinone oxidoreductase family protein [unclassified Undibacterium]MDY7538052.1 NADPH:quinone oxidoreductase family protein [Undibacterium sp. 5I1]MEB0032545.1 NADPH:quinone oxidoreductase family protein [Undibacterium sp. RTI2.1]MEB0117884.1 NADPH:quinone oxidoreductase family protein [Undibacterium sp. RTI2.2]MEB0231661.1 NADPH:quinone oxidoreductase family protein [Undibacterium sp. 10I3]MEB0258672.1 NADPH:quinone oxidoreductase family protein [Undibacterium sp. 5I1]